MIINQLPGASLIEKTVTANGVYTVAEDDADGYSKITASVQRVQLYPPTVALSGSVLTITQCADNGAFCESYRVYSNGELLRVLATGLTQDVELSSLITEPGVYTLTVRSFASGADTSGATAPLSYLAGE